METACEADEMHTCLGKQETVAAVATVLLAVSHCWIRVLQ